MTTTNDTLHNLPIAYLRECYRKLKRGEIVLITDYDTSDKDQVTELIKFFWQYEVVSEYFFTEYGWVYIFPKF